MENDLRLQKVLFTHASEKMKRKRKKKEVTQREKKKKEVTQREKKRDESRRMGLRQELEEHFGNPILVGEWAQPRH